MNEISQGVTVVGYIPTPEGVAALDWAIADCLEYGRRLVVVNTGHHGDNSDPVFATAQDIDSIDTQLAQAGIEHEVRQVPSGTSAAGEIRRAADEHGADLIVIGLRRRTPIGKYLTGSTAQEVLLDAPCAVLAVKAG